MYVESCTILVVCGSFIKTRLVLNGLPGLYGLKYDSATACGLPLYLCSYKLVGSATVMILANQIEWICMNDDIVSIFF